MKASLKLREDHHHDNHHHHHHQHHHKNPLLRLKVPISILGLPFISSITAGDSTDLSFNVRSNCNNGPSFKLSYSPNTTNSIIANSFSVSLKSGVGIFGSPNNSPLIMSAHFNLFGNLNPTFSLQIKPHFGDFSLSKTAVSACLPNPNPNPNFPKDTGGFYANGGVDGVLPERINGIGGGGGGGGDGDGIFSGVAVRAKTVLPVAKRAEVKFRWGVNFATDSSEKLKLPFLTVDKISIERVEEEAAAAVEVVKPPKNGGGSDVRDLELLKGMFCLMRKEVEDLQRENCAIKETLGEVRLGNLGRRRLESSYVNKNVVPLTPSVGNSSEFERWRSKKSGGEENGGREVKKSGGSENLAEDVGEELKRAIKAASSNGV